MRLEVTGDWRPWAFKTSFESEAEALEDFYLMDLIIRETGGSDLFLEKSRKVTFPIIADSGTGPKKRLPILRHKGNLYLTT